MPPYKPPRNVVLLGLTSFLNDASNEMILAAFPAFFVSVLKAGAASLGIVEGIADAAANLIKIYSGRLSDKLGKRKLFIVIGYSLAVATRPLYLFMTSVAGVAGLRLVDRVGKGLREGPRDAIISLSSKESEYGRAFGLHRALDTLGAIVGPLAAYFILRAYPGDFNVIFLAAFVVGILAVLSLFFVRDVVGTFSHHRLSIGVLAVHSREFKRYLLSLFFLSLGTIPVAVMLLKTQSLGLMLADIPLFYLFYSTSYAGFSYLAGRMSDRWGERHVISIGSGALLVGYTLLALSSGPVVLACSFFILGLFPAMTDGVQRALASSLSPEEHRAGALGLANAVAGFGLLFAGALGGYLWQFYSPSAALALAGVMSILGIVLLHTIKK